MAMSTQYITHLEHPSYDMFYCKRAVFNIFYFLLYIQDVSFVNNTFFTLVRNSLILLIFRPDHQPQHNEKTAK